jgi:hypothetical protein
MTDGRQSTPPFSTTLTDVTDICGLAQDQRLLDAGQHPFDRPGDPAIDRRGWRIRTDQLLEHPLSDCRYHLVWCTRFGPESVEFYDGIGKALRL